MIDAFSLLPLLSLHSNDHQSPSLRVPSEMASSSNSSSAESYAMKSPRSNNPQYPPSPPLSHHSNDSDDYLRALELSDGPIGLSSGAASRARSYSFSGFDFQQDLLPLSASLSNPDGPISEGVGKDISLVNGEQSFFCTRKLLASN